MRYAVIVSDPKTHTVVVVKCASWSEVADIESRPFYVGTVIGGWRVDGKVRTMSYEEYISWRALR